MTTQTIRLTGLIYKRLPPNSFMLQLRKRVRDSGGERERIEGVASHSLPLSYNPYALSLTPTIFLSSTVDEEQMIDDRLFSIRPVVLIIREFIANIQPLNPQLQ